jgi:hypothetical protein
MKKNNQKTTPLEKSLTEKSKEAELALAKAQAEYNNVIEEAGKHIEAAKKIITDNGLVPIIRFSESQLLAFLKQLYKEGAEEIQIPNPDIKYIILSLSETNTVPQENTENIGEAQEVDYEIVETNSK